MKVLPQEIEVWYVLPAVRKEIVYAMLKKGLKQNEIAKIMGSTEASISQYVKGKRGCELILNSEVKKIIEAKALKVIKKPETLPEEVSKLSKKIMSMGVICAFHKKTDQKVPAKCCVCGKNAASLIRKIKKQQKAGK